MHGAMAAGHGADQEPPSVLYLERREHGIPRSEQFCRRIRTHTVSDVVAMKKVDLVDGLPVCGQFAGELARGSVHVPIPGSSRLRAGLRLDAVHRTNPVGMRGDQGAVVALLSVG